MPITPLLVALLGAVFLKAFKEAIGIAVTLVGVYLALNLIVVIIGLEQIAAHPHVLRIGKLRSLPHMVAL
jgi:hypothetical protein